MRPSPSATSLGRWRGSRPLRTKRARVQVRVSTRSRTADPGPYPSFSREAINATGYSLAYEAAHQDLGVSRLTWTIGNTLVSSDRSAARPLCPCTRSADRPPRCRYSPLQYLVAVAITPLFLAPLSEV